MGTGCDLVSIRIPFFFEPSFDALVKPLDAALRMQAENPDPSLPGQAKMAEKKYEPVRYGEFLTRKVGSNFATGKGKYD